MIHVEVLRGLSQEAQLDIRQTLGVSAPVKPRQVDKAEYSASRAGDKLNHGELARRPHFGLDDQAVTDRATERDGQTVLDWT